MAKNITCISNYLSALLTSAESDSEKVTLLEQVIEFSNALVSNQNIWVFLNSPLMSSSEKVGVLSNFSKRLEINDKVLNLFSLFIKNNRLEIVGDLIKSCEEQKDLLNSVANIDVLSSEEFSEEQLSKLKKKLEENGYKNINFSSKKDSSLIAGFKILTKNKVYDLTLNSVLTEFKEKIKQN
ncbi:MAG: ATP synthase F1 subunit delta [Candidatus Margulisiibacteriota bacterium]|nr:ATP synthase F1 subunit delta [Candidatus Margulisiibacteriota bacterium]